MGVTISVIGVTEAVELMSEIDEVLVENPASVALEPAGENPVEVEVPIPMESKDINSNEDSLTDLNG